MVLSFLTELVTRIGEISLGLFVYIKDIKTPRLRRQGEELFPEETCAIYNLCVPPLWNGGGHLKPSDQDFNRTVKNTWAVI